MIESSQSSSSETTCKDLSGSASCVCWFVFSCLSLMGFSSSASAFFLLDVWVRLARFRFVSGAGGKPNGTGLLSPTFSILLAFVSVFSGVLLRSSLFFLGLFFGVVTGSSTGFDSHPAAKHSSGSSAWRPWARNKLCQLASLLWLSHWLHSS